MNFQKLFLSRKTTEENLAKILRSRASGWSSFLSKYWEVEWSLPKVTMKSIRSLWLIRDTHPLFAERTHNQHSSDMIFRKSIERLGHFNTAIPLGAYVWKPIEGFIGSAMRTAEEIKRRSQLDTDLSLMVLRRQQLSLHFRAGTSDQFCIFAQRMRQNMIDWEKFCEK